MAALTAALIASTVISAGAQVAQGIGQRQAAHDLTTEGARLAADARRRGAEAAARYRTDLDQILGAQRVGAAAQGLDLTFGDPARIAADTTRIGEVDIAMIRRNAEREAFGLRANANAQATALRTQATGSFIGAGGTLITSGMDAYGNWAASRNLTVPRLRPPRSVSSRGITSVGRPAGFGSPAGYP